MCLPSFNSTFNENSVKYFMYFCFLSNDSSMSFSSAIVQLNSVILQTAFVRLYISCCKDKAKHLIGLKTSRYIAIFTI